MENKETSYTAASSLPLKILLDKELVESMDINKRILPRHIQLNPENKCTKNCEWCSCSNRDKSLEMPYETVMEVMKKFKSLGAKGCTITGGGEFLCHPRASDIISGIYDLGIDVGLVTNSDLIHKLKESDLEKIIWMRISSGDGKKINEDFWINLVKAIEKGKGVDWSFSYVIANQSPDYKLIKDIVRCANYFNFTHVRLVNDIFNADKLVDAMDSVKTYLRRKGIKDSKVIYQDRSEWTGGTKKCLISLLKPVVTADGKLAPCCGDQYKDEPPARDYIGDWGTIDDIDEIWRGNRVYAQKYYDGSKCKKCYYDNYNVLLSTLQEEIKHKNFA